MTTTKTSYDAGLLNDFGGGNVEWWQDYIRAELGRAHDFYAAEIESLEGACAEFVRLQHELCQLLGCDEDTDSIDLHERIKGGLERLRARVELLEWRATRVKDFLDGYDCAPNAAKEVLYGAYDHERQTEAKS